MAVTAEQADGFEKFDKHYYEIQRRLQLAPRIGKLAIEGERLDAIERRRKDELIDGIAEAIPGIVKNRRSYRLKDKLIVAEDDQPIEQLLINGLSSSIRQATQDEFYAPFGPLRARHELDELRELQAMATEPRTHNTLLVISPFSEEYANEKTINKLQLAGQAPDQKRGMIRIGHWDGEQLHIITRSIDNSSLGLFKTAAKEVLGYNFRSDNTTQILGERIGLAMNLDEAEMLADNLVNSADSQLSSSRGGVWSQGRSIEQAANTQAFVESQSQIIDYLMHMAKVLAVEHQDYASYKTAWEAEMHKHIALLEFRLASNDNQKITDVRVAAEAAGMAAEALGKTYNMCGLVVVGSNEKQTASDTGYESLKSLSGKKIQCPECKESVVVSDSKLRKGKLCCPECRYEVDVCTGQIHNRSDSKKISTANRGNSVAPGNIIAKDLARIDADIARKRAIKKQRMRVAG